ncbi:protein TonB [Collimonas sp. OK242]|uniref:energy transducer TonB n=1 Tax=Collimonas sp. OK242 TaxID=1798195 RepID=UPI00089B80B5|nr:TonB family protein [Collimonas sp. OK242]SDX06176.1 protein TonB [Collimonas sp. OK242]
MSMFYVNRNMIAALPSASLLVFLLFGMISSVRPLKPKYDEPIKLEMVEMPAPTPAPVSPKTEAKQEAAAPQRPQPPVPPQPPRQAPSELAHTPQPPMPASPVASPTAAPAPATPAEPVSPSKPPEPAPVAAAKPNVDGEYIARIRSYLNSIKRYPSGREASQLRPEGTVKIWFVLRRDGSLVDSGIEQSSNSTLLDEAARKTVSRATFPGFPEQFMADQETHRFSVDLQFRPAN